SRTIRESHCGCRGQSRNGERFPRESTEQLDVPPPRTPEVESRRLDQRVFGATRNSCGRGADWIRSLILATTSRKSGAAAARPSGVSSERTSSFTISNGEPRRGHSAGKSCAIHCTCSSPE